MSLPFFHIFSSPADFVTLQSPLLQTDGKGSTQRESQPERRKEERGWIGKEEEEAVGVEFASFRFALTSAVDK